MDRESIIDSPTVDLTIDRVTLPLHCFFVGGDLVWMTETRRYMNSVSLANRRTPSHTEIRWETKSEVGDLNQLPTNCLVAIHLDIFDHDLDEVAEKPQIESALRTIHTLNELGVVVAVTSGPAAKRFSLALRAAGAVVLVTDIFGCKKLASTIERVAMIVPSVPTNWRTRFVNRLPWKPVKD